MLRLVELYPEILRELKLIMHGRSDSLAGPGLPSQCDPGMRRVRGASQPSMAAI